MREFVRRRREMGGEEIAGPPAPKVLRLLYFVGAGFICTVGINKWREMQRKSMALQQHQQQQQLPENAANALE